MKKTSLRAFNPERRQTHTNEVAVRQDALDLEAVLYFDNKPGKRVYCVEIYDILTDPLLGSEPACALLKRLYVPDNKYQLKKYRGLSVYACLCIETDDFLDSCNGMGLRLYAKFLDGALKRILRLSSPPKNVRKPPKNG